MFRATYEHILYIDSFKNIDLYQQGLYYLRFCISLNSELATPYNFFEVKQKKKDQQQNWVAAQIEEDAHIFHTKTFMIRFQEEEVEVDEGCVFKIEVAGSQHYEWEFKLQCDLMCADLSKIGGPPSEDESLFNVVATYEAIINNSYKGVHEYIPILFDSHHFCLVNCMLHSTLSDFKFRALENSQNQQFFAARVMRVKHDKDIDDYKSEILIMESLKNKNVVNYIESFLYQDCIFMILEYMDRGCLTQFIEQHKHKPFSEPMIAYILGEILNGLYCIHQHKRIHRDMKSDNILMNSQGELKIADLGQAIQLTEDDAYRQTVVGTPAWMAPELIQGQEYDEKVDIWSLGIIGFELAYGEPPLLRMHPIKAMHMIVKNDPPQITKNFSTQFRDFISKCLVKNHKKRSSALDLLKHEFILTQRSQGRSELKNDLN